MATRGRSRPHPTARLENGRSSVSKVNPRARQTNHTSHESAHIHQSPPVSHHTRRRIGRSFHESLFSRAAANIVRAVSRIRPRPPLNTDADVIVCGAGPAGVTAAITAARAGAKVRLFELHGSLGGVWTSSLLGYLLDFNKPGFNVELVRRLRERDAINGGGMNGLSYQPEEMKLLLEELCTAAGVKVQLHTRVAAAYREGRSLRTIVTESKSGRQAWKARVFIDTTGDGDLGAQAGCEFEIGKQQSCPCQPMTMYALLVVKNVAELVDCLHGTGNNGQYVGPKAFQDTLKRAGVTPSYGKACLFPIQGNLVLLMANHEYGINATDASQVTEATLRARGELHQIVRGLRKLGGPWDGVQIAATPEQIGIRDGRRIRGRYVMGKEDLIEGRKQADAVVRATFPVDIHALSAEDNKKSAYSNGGVKMKPYDIRCARSSPETWTAS